MFTLLFFKWEMILYNLFFSTTAYKLVLSAFFAIGKTISLLEKQLIRPIFPEDLS